MSPYLALGDSYTIGEGVDACGRWPAQLARHLREAGIDAGDPDIIATTGWTTDELSAAIESACPMGGRQLVSLLIGVNNQYRGRSIDNYRDEFSALLEQAIGFAAGRARRVIVVSIPDWGVTPFAAQRGVDAARVAAEIDAFNAVAHDVAASRGTHWVDVTGLSRGEGRDLLAADGLHPSAAQYALWSRAIECVAPMAFSA